MKKIILVIVSIVALLIVIVLAGRIRWDADVEFPNTSTDSSQASANASSDSANRFRELPGAAHPRGFAEMPVRSLQVFGANGRLAPTFAERYGLGTQQIAVIEAGKQSALNALAKVEAQRFEIALNTPERFEGQVGDVLREGRKIFDKFEETMRQALGDGAYADYVDHRAVVAGADDEFYQVLNAGVMQKRLAITSITSVEGKKEFEVTVTRSTPNQPSYSKKPIVTRSMRTGRIDTLADLGKFDHFAPLVVDQWLK